MSEDPLPFCGIPGHPSTGHGSHPGCNEHGDMRFRASDRMWVCNGLDGEGCNLPPVPDAY